MRPGLALLLVLAVAPVCADGVFKWEDEHGVVHYGDRVPAEDAKRERYILNDHGVAVETLSRELSPAERAIRRGMAEEAARIEAERQRQLEYDRILLATYLSVEDIVQLRDERLTTLAGQLRVNEHYVKTLREQLLRMEERAKRYNYPFDPESDLPPLPEKVAENLLDTANGLAQREEDISRIRREQARISTAFEADIRRFRSLKSKPESLAEVPAN